jgi:hypothetical protein
MVMVGQQCPTWLILLYLETQCGNWVCLIAEVRQERRENMLSKSQTSNKKPAILQIPAISRANSGGKGSHIQNIVRIFHIKISVTISPTNLVFLPQF